MPAKKFKFEVHDLKGNRYALTFKGQISRDKVLNLLDMVDLLGDGTDSSSQWRSTSDNGSKFDNLCYLVKQRFPFHWFSSKDAQKMYEQELNEPISLSTTSTYLARMVDRGLLTRKGPANQMRYKLSMPPHQNTIEYLKDNK